ncbi:MAG TPA: hypothetical protein VK787_04280 [Puia sp.]|jgi:antitoxin component YwqK of YwqJK toxin-antitoxin module|nr:hypothetical protein [Puia sp.]
MRYIFVLLMLIAANAYSQCKTYIIGAKGDTLNCVDKKDLKQGKWLIHHDELRGEPGFEEEGEYKTGRKEGVWRQYSLSGDLVGAEFYKWGNKDGVCKYFSPSGELLREESWIALNPDKPYDTLQIEDVDQLDHYKTVVVKNEGVAIKNGTWKYYDPTTGTIYKTETYTVGKLEIPKTTASNNTPDSTKSKIIPKEVLDYQKKNSGKKQIKVRDGSVY